MTDDDLTPPSVLARWQQIALFVIGAAGLTYELILSAQDTRLWLIVTDLVLVGLVPVDLILRRLHVFDRPDPPVGPTGEDDRDA